MVESCKCVVNNLKGLGTLANANNLTGLNALGSDVDYLAINNNVLVKDELTSSSAGWSDT